MNPAARLGSGVRLGALLAPVFDAGKFCGLFTTISLVQSVLASLRLSLFVSMCPQSALVLTLKADPNLTAFNGLKLSEF